ncbi:unannotated protein [freshwater metagenome]|uniref:Unannotated protein n=1 Tax=freshwater metagenome TaxID=449393 RepID=A0A6J5ZKK3_9ZZZZ
MASAAGSEISASTPLLGEDLLTSAIRRMPSLLKADFAPLNPGADAMAFFNSAIGTIRDFTSSKTPSIIEESTFSEGALKLFFISGIQAVS